MNRGAISFLIVLALVALVRGHNKYSKEANKNLASVKQPFRMQKLNLIWEKATKKLDEKVLKRLFDDLKHQDKDELALKKMKGDNQDRDGTQEARVRKQLSVLLAKYSLEQVEGNTKLSKPNSDETPLHERALFKDKKLDKLWKKAQKADFTEPQLKILKEELRHYEEKMEQYHHMASELDHVNIDQTHEDRKENHIDAFMDEEHKSEATKNKLQEKHIELKEEYRRLSDMVHEGPTNGSQFGGQFEEDQVSKLWALAQKSDFTEEELDSLRDELDRFEKRIKKLKFFEAQIESDRMAGKRDLNQPIDDHTSHQKHIVRKVKELNYKVDKMHSELEDRILRRHSEL